MVKVSIMNADDAAILLQKSSQTPRFPNSLACSILKGSEKEKKQDSSNFQYSHIKSELSANFRSHSIRNSHATPPDRPRCVTRTTSAGGWPTYHPKFYPYQASYNDDGRHIDTSQRRPAIAAPHHSRRDVHHPGKKKNTTTIPILIQMLINASDPADSLSRLQDLHPAAEHRRRDGRATR